jgi:hypothetical protein
MALTKLIMKIFYADVKVGLSFFVDGLGFKLGYSDDTLYIIERDDIRLMLVEDAEYAAKDRPEFRIVTDDIESIYNEIKSRNPALLHPNGNVIEDKPWGLREFAALDPTTVCVIFQQEIR